MSIFVTKHFNFLYEILHLDMYMYMYKNCRLHLYIKFNGKDSYNVEKPKIYVLNKMYQNRYSCLLSSICNDKIDGIGILCRSANVMNIFNSSPRRRRSHSHRHYTSPMLVVPIRICLI